MKRRLFRQDNNNVTSLYQLCSTNFSLMYDEHAYLILPQFVIVAAGLHGWMSPDGTKGDTERVKTGKAVKRNSNKTRLVK